jgi:hypothetical protein
VEGYPFFFSFVSSFFLFATLESVVRSFVQSKKERVYIYRRATNRKIDTMHHHFLSLKANTQTQSITMITAIVASPVVAAVKKVLY